MEPARERITLRPASVGTEVSVLRIERGKTERPGRVALVLHGLGDHIGRHEWVLQMLVSAGYDVVGIDWPGNGLSGRKRGDLPSVASVPNLLEEVLEALSIKPDGVMAHSTGGFFLERVLRNPPPSLRHLKWVWFSSPLVDPAHGQPRWKANLAGRVAQWLPDVTVSTGVRPVDCYHVPRDEDPLHFRAGSHNRITLRAGADLIAAAKAPDSADPLHLGFPCLISQGADDEVCPPELALDLFRRIDSHEKTFVLAAGARHEPFREPDAAKFDNAVRSWLRSREA